MELILQNSLCNMALVGSRALDVILCIICVCFIRQCRLLHMVGLVKGRAVGPEDRYSNLVCRWALHPPPPPGATQPIVGVYFTALYRALASSRMRVLDHTQRRAAVGRTPLNE
jgi:hypothetical protein